MTDEEKLKGVILIAKHQAAFFDLRDWLKANGYLSDYPDEITKDALAIVTKGRVDEYK